MVTPSSFHALRFGRAAAGYDAHARVQARMAEALVGLWGDRPDPARLLEFGCGTGLLTRRLRARFPAAAIAATDAAPEMVEAAHAALSGARPQVVFATLDACGESRAEWGRQGTPPELLASNALVQWFPDLVAHLRFATSLAASGAHYLMSGFDCANFPELNALLREPPFSYAAFPGHSRTDVEAAARATEWNVSAFVEWEEKEILPSARAVLRRMQDLGSVRDPRAGGRMNRANLAHLLAEYDRRFAAGEPGGGVRLTWKPWAALLARG